jgi:hypothetical protein
MKHWPLIGLFSELFQLDFSKWWVCLKVTNSLICGVFYHYRQYLIMSPLRKTSSRQIKLNVTYTLLSWLLYRVEKANKKFRNVFRSTTASSVEKTTSLVLNARKSFTTWTFLRYENLRTCVYPYWKGTELNETLALPTEYDRARRKHFKSSCNFSKRNELAICFTPSMTCRAELSENVRL